jgi:hypothetical protein
MNTPFDFMNTPYLYMNACFLKMRVVCFLKINVVIFMRGTRKARGIAAEPPLGVKRPKVMERIARRKRRGTRREAARPNPYFAQFI